MHIKIFNFIKIIKITKKYLLISFLLLIISSILSFYAPFTKLKKVETPHFYIYYPENLEKLIDENYIHFMEKSYDFLSNLFKYVFKYKINVYFSDTDKIANGFSSPIGNSTIYLITTPPPVNSSIGNFENWLQMVFYHELTHQFSLNLQNPFIEFISAIFGNIFLINYFKNPFFMIEGVTVSLEGQGKNFGRVNDPMVKQIILQDIIDKNFKNPYQLEQSYDYDWPYHSLGYFYGGYFSYFLQEKYGIEKYINLWKETLKLFNSYEDAFEIVYNKTLQELWNEFYEFLKPDFEIYINSNDLTKYKEKSFYFNGRISKEENKIYYYYFNLRNRSIERLELNTLKTEIVLNNLLNFSSFEISEKNNKLIISYYDFLPYNNLTIKYKIFNLKNKKFEKSNIEKLLNLNELNFYNDSYIGIDISDSFTNLVSIDQANNIKILLKGSKEFYISNPSQYKDKILFLGNFKGKKNLYIYDLNNNKLEILKTNISNIHSYNVYEDRIFLTYNDDFSLNKFSIIENDNELDFLKNYSGGFFNPYLYENKLIYIARYAKYSRIQYLKFNDFEDNNFYKSKIQIIDIDINSLYTNNKENELELNKNLIIKESNVIFPFEKSILPNAWFPTPSISFIFNKLVFNGIGPSFIWMDNITNSLSILNLSVNIYNNKLYPSISYTAILNYFDPLIINLNFEFANGFDLLLNNPFFFNYISFNLSLTYLSFLSLPIKSDILQLNLNIGFIDKNDPNYLDFNNSFLFYIYNTLKLKLIILNQMEFSSISLIYFSQLDKNINNIKFEIKNDFYFFNIGLNLNNSLIISMNKNLPFLGSNDFYNFSVIPYLFEFSIDYENYEYNFALISSIDLLIIESKPNKLINFLFYIYYIKIIAGYKICLAGVYNYNNFYFENYIHDEYLFLKIKTYYSINSNISLNFNFSYSYLNNKFYFFNEIEIIF